MIRAKDIQEKLLHLVGWQKNYGTSPDLEIFDNLTESESGLFFQQIHPLLTLQNIASIAPDFKNIEYTRFSPNKYYNKGDIVLHNGSLYICKQSNIIGLTPDGEYTAPNILEPLNYSFENKEDFLKNWSKGHPDNDNRRYTAIYPGYNSDTAAGINSMSMTYAIGLTLSQATLSSIPIKLGHTYKFQFAIKLNSGNTSTAYGNLKCYYKYNSNYVKQEVAAYNIAKTNYDWHIISGIINVTTDDDNAVWYEISINPNLKSSVIVDEIKLIDITYAEVELNHLSDYWEKIESFSGWLEDKTKASIIKAITRYCNEKTVEGTNKPLCMNRTLFEGAGRLTDTVKNKNNIVGLEIVPIRAKGVTVKINRIGLQFTTPGKYKIYLMHSGDPSPVKTFELEKKNGRGVEWFNIPNLYLPYQPECGDAGGSWYLCYSQLELPEYSQAIRKDKDWSKKPCGSCSRQELIAWQAWSKYIEVHPFFVNPEVSTDARIGISGGAKFGLWDIEHNQYTYDNNYGLNLDITVECDITDFIIEQRMMFADIIAKQVAVDMLREFAYNANVRTNRHSINASKLDILYELDGDSSSMKKSGLNYQLDKAFEAVKLSTSGIDRVCLPCKNNGIKYRTI